jgi:hypothetical protein
MSVENFIGDILSGNFSNALKRLEDWWSGMQPELKAFVQKFATDEGQIVWNAAKAGLSDLASGKTIPQAAADIWATISTQAPSMALTDVEDALGILSRAQTTSTT